jgi:hypothetical protein
MKIKALLLVAIFTCALSRPNYQERIIYIDEKDNVCHYGESSDIVWLNIDMDGKKSTRIAAWAKTGCTDGTINIQRITPMTYWTYIAFEDHYIRFNEETSFIAQNGVCLAIIQKTTIINPAKVFSQDYNCMIDGDGELRHFGIDFEGEEPA